MKYTWTKQEITATRLYWIDQDRAAHKRWVIRNRIFDSVYYSVLIAGILGSVFLFGGGL